VAGSVNGDFSIWIKNEDPFSPQSEDETKLSFLITLTSERNNRVTCLDIFNDEILTAAFNSNDIATLDLFKILPTVPE
jgi:hypothetical protein